MRKDKALLRLLSNPRVIALHYSPSISRTIPAPVALPWTKLLNEWLIVGFVSGILLFLSASLSIEIKTQLFELSRLRMTHEGIVSEIAYWQKLTQKYPDFRDGYFRMSLLQYQLGNERLAGMYLEKSLAIDPNFAAGVAFQEKLQEK